jgi:hypothetical protein
MGYPLSHQLLTVIVGGVQFRENIPVLPQNPTAEIRGNGVLGQEICLLCKAIAGFLFGHNGKALFLKLFDGFPDGVATDS